MADLVFETHYDRHGYMKDPSLLFDGPIAPGTLIIKVPVVSQINLRVGMIVAVHSGQVDVVWHPWSSDPTIKDGELRQRLGIPNSRQRRELKKRQQTAAWALHRREQQAQRQQEGNTTP